MSSSPDDRARAGWQHVFDEYSRARQALLDGDIGAAQAAVDQVGEELARLTIAPAANDGMRGRAARAHAELLALAVSHRESLATDLNRLRDGRRALRGYQLGRRAPVRHSSA